MDEKIKYTTKSSEDGTKALSDNCLNICISYCYQLPPSNPHLKEPHKILP